MRTSSKGRVLQLLYVNDTSDYTAGIADTQRYLHRQFQMKNLGHLWYYLGLEIAQDEWRILIFQQKYTSDIIEAVALTT